MPRELNPDIPEGFEQITMHAMAADISKRYPSATRMLADLDYYSRKVPQKKTPAMTQSMFSVICSRCGDAAQAWKWFVDSYRPNALPPFGVLAEFKGGTNPYFATGAGGTLQAVIFGFAGLEFAPGGGVMQVGNHALPPHWKRLTIKGVGPEKKTYVIE